MTGPRRGQMSRQALRIARGGVPLEHRPDHALVEARVFDERYRVRPEVRRARQVVAEFRCRRLGHLQGLVVRQPAGLWVAWHPAGYPLDVWEQEWCRLASTHIRVTCSCTTRRVDLRWVR